MSKKFSKILIIFFIIFSSSFFSVFSLSYEEDLSLLSANLKESELFIADFSDVVSAFSDEDLFNFDLALKEEFSLSWTDKNIHESSRGIMANFLSPLLSELLPCKRALFSKVLEQQDGSKSFRFYSLDSKKTYSVVMKDQQIVSITLI